MKKNRQQLNSHFSSQSNKTIPNQIKFLSFQQQLNAKISSHQGMKYQQNQDLTQDHKQFSPLERQNLKNAFRYICRLAFKESTKYLNQINAIVSNITKGKNHNGGQKIRNLLKDAQVISGQRYFKEYLSNLNIEDQRIIVEYMRWFLERKYLRYLRVTQNQKGKRKSMKKQLYLRFKNEVMLPYLLDYLEKIQKY